MARNRSKTVRNATVEYTDDDFEQRRGAVTERNGNLAYVVDRETGEGSYRAPHEIQRDW